MFWWNRHSVFLESIHFLFGNVKPKSPILFRSKRKTMSSLSIVPEAAGNLWDGSQKWTKRSSRPCCHRGCRLCGVPKADRQLTQPEPLGNGAWVVIHYCWLLDSSEGNWNSIPSFTTLSHGIIFSGFLGKLKYLRRISGTVVSACFVSR